MKKVTFAFLTVALALTTATAAMAQTTTLSATIDASQEVPPNGSGGTGTGGFTLDEGAGMLFWNISFSGLSGTETGAHIHGPAPAGANAGVQIPLAGGSPKIGSAAVNATQIADLKAGLYYVNIHTDVQPGGEIRGQILPLGEKVPATNAWSLALLALALVGAFVLIRRRLAT